MKLLTGNVQTAPFRASEPSQTFTYLLAAALIEGMLISWLPRYLAVSVAHAGILLIAIAWTLLNRRFFLSPALIPAGLLGLWGLAQILLGATRSLWLTRQSTLTWFTCSVAFLLAATILDGERARDRFLNVIFWAVSLLAVAALLQMYHQPIYVFGLFPAEPTVVGTFLYKNQFAAMLMLAAPIALYRMIELEGQEWIGAGAFAIMFGAAVGASSRAGVLLLAAELVTALGIAAKRRTLPWKNLLTLSGGLLLLIAATSIIAGTQSIIEHFQQQSPYSIRNKLLISTLHMIATKPLTGYGLGTWPEVYPAFANFDLGRFANEAHNDWAQWAAEGGIPFALILAYITVRLIRPAVRSIWGIGLIAVMIQSLVDYPTREPVLAIFWFTLAGAVTRYAAQPQNP